jgi:hypothetical protein
MGAIENSPRKSKPGHSVPILLQENSDLGPSTSQDPSLLLWNEAVAIITDNQNIIPNDGSSLGIIISDGKNQKLDPVARLSPSCLDPLPKCGHSI